MLSSKFKIGADASAAAGPVGRDAAANTDWKMKAELLTYSRSRGLFAGIDLSGSAVTQDRDATHLLYGRSIPFGAILTGRVPPPKESQTFLSAVKKYAPTQTQTGSLAKPGTERANAEPKMRMQRNFEPMRKQVEAVQRSELADVTATVVIYKAFV